MSTVVKIMVSIALQIIALSALRYELYMFGAGVIIADIVYLYVIMILDVKKSLGKRICRKCGTEFARKLRVCPACGEAYREVDMEKEFSAVIAGENEKETEKSPEQINRDYERIEEMNVEAAFSLDESDIDEIIREKQLRDDSE
ncbi:MAG: hypothetical protein LUI87_16765 [Lachnospiraceae bacterium]|nr:hypothetical protein [Lachnospiraceae bacterium]